MRTLDNTANHAAIGRYLGLCRRAGDVIRGGDTLMAAIRSAKKPAAVLLSADISARSEKQYTDKANTYGVPVCKTAWSSEELAHLLGYVSPAAAVGLANGKGPTAALVKALQASDDPPRKEPQDPAAPPDTAEAAAEEDTKRLTNDVSDRKDDGQWQ